MNDMYLHTFDSHSISHGQEKICPYLIPPTFVSFFFFSHLFLISNIHHPLLIPSSSRITHKKVISTTLNNKKQQQQNIHCTYTPLTTKHLPPSSTKKRHIMTNKAKEDAEKREAAAVAKCLAEHTFPPKLSGWELFRSIGSPKHVVAPMVNTLSLYFCPHHLLMQFPSFLLTALCHLR